MNRLVWLLDEIADRVFPLLALCGYMGSFVFLGLSDNPLYVFWALCAVGSSSVAMWAFWSDK